jgi:hypothetical protein
LDELQDLPPVVTYLISFFFTDGLYYAGDSAQAIQKGVDFKFDEFHLMFQKNFALDPITWEKPKMHVLT